MANAEKLKLIDFRGRPPTPEFNSYFIRESTVAVNFKVGAKQVSPAYLADSTELRLRELERVLAEMGLRRSSRHGAVPPGSTGRWRVYGAPRA